MDSLERCLKSLNENEIYVREEARKALLNICNKVLQSPDDDKSRELRLDDEVVIEKLLPAVGAMECLFEIGYVEDGERIFLPHNASLSKLQHLSKQLSIVRNSFFKRIAQFFRRVMLYEDPVLQRKARSHIPIVQLEIAAMKKMREIQKIFKSADATNAASSFEEELIASDLFLHELLHWFKNDFFKWVDHPICSNCSIACTYEKVVFRPNSHCYQVEIYKCEKCNLIIEFPRYSDPEPLLTLRRGRCGEWANVFTLLCRSLGYDTRIVYDETDHLWTEIWSMTKKRWIHVDSCENVIDKPLMYEKGWKKKLTYIIACSKDEMQDVTWRYTTDYEAVMKRRKLCSEHGLIKMIQLMNYKRQNAAGYSQARREYVIKRSLLELVSMLHIPNSQTKSSDETYEGRSSGSLAWRLARGEITQNTVQKKNYVWNISKYGKTFELRYNIIKDMYYVVNNDTILEQMCGWLEGMNTTEGGIIRKVENDWKMVYLTRSPEEKYGLIKWTFEIVDPDLYLDTFSLRAKSETFHGATVSWEIEAIFSDNRTIVIPIINCNKCYMEEIQKAVKLNLIVTLSGGQGEPAWQHAQLFRQGLQDTEKPSMTINIRLKNRST